MRKLAVLSVAFALVAVSFYGCDEAMPTEAPTPGVSNDEGVLISAAMAKKGGAELLWAEVVASPGGGTTLGRAHGVKSFTNNGVPSSLIGFNRKIDKCAVILSPKYHTTNYEWGLQTRRVYNLDYVRESDRELDVTGYVVYYPGGSYTISSTHYTVLLLCPEDD